MSPLIVLVSEARDTRLGALLAVVIGQRNDITLHGDRVWPIRDNTQLNQLGTLPSIAILVGPAADLEEATAQLGRRGPDLLIVRIITDNDDADLAFSPEHANELISLLIPLAPVPGARAQQRQLNFQVMPDALAIPPQARFAEIPPGHGIFRHVIVWLDAVLRVHLRRSADPGDDLPGLSVSRDTIEQLLATTSLLRDGEHDSALSARSAAEDTLFRLLDECTSPADPLAILYSRLKLTRTDTCAFLLCLAPELDARYQRIFGYIHDDLGRRNASLGLITTVLGDAVTTRADLARSNRLFDWQLVHTPEHDAPHADAPLRVDPCIMAWLYGNRSALIRDNQLTVLLHEAPWPGAGWCDAPATADVMRALEPAPDRAHWLILSGDDSCAWRAMLERSGTAGHAPLLRITLSAPGEPDASEERLMRLVRAARLMGRTPVFDASMLERSPMLTAALQRVVRAVAGLPLVPVLIVRDVGVAIDAFPAGAYRLMDQDTPAAGHTWFARAACEAGLALNPNDIALLAAAYPLPLDGLERALHLAAARGARGQPEAQQAAAVGAACHLVACPQLPLFATRLAPSFALDDLVLPHDRRLQLDELVAHVSFANTVLNTWGFGAQLPYGKGVAALFSGASGTGKTMAARAIGHALQRSVFAVDLSRVLSKYIGEMEKNLHALFNEADKAGAILLFDEADALFGKRSETKDAHDRYANIETAYLLQRIEAFSGLAILTTNFGQNLDRAFLRRLRFVIDFPLPGAADRETIWRQCLPAGAPLAQDIDLAFLARRVEISGGHIRQITLRAAFAAAAERAEIGMGHLLRATRAEAIKLGMPALERELAELAVAA